MGLKNGIGKYTPGCVKFTGGGGAVINYNFLSGLLPFGITFTRGSVATEYDPAGVIVFAPENLLLQSSDLTQSPTWFTGGLTVANVVPPAPPPDGHSLVSEITLGDPAGNIVGQTISVQPTTGYTFSFYALAGTADSLQYSVSDNTHSTEIIYQSGNYFGSLSPAAWVRISVPFITPSGCTSIVVAPTHDGGGSVGTAYFTDFQLEQTSYDSPLPYNATTSAAYYGPRFDYNPATLALNGLLIEQATTNVATNSLALTSADQFNNVITVNSLTSPDGTVDASLLTDDTSTNSHAAFVGGNTVTSTDTYTVSTFVKNGSIRYISLRSMSNVSSSNFAWITFDTVAQSIATNASVTASGWQSVGNGWFRVYLTWISGQTENASGVIGSNNSSSAPSTGSGFPASYTGTSQNWYQWGMQIENTGFPTSPTAPTSASSATRSMDSAIVTSIPWFNAATGSFIVSAIIPYLNSSRSTCVASFNDGTANNEIKIIINASGIPEAQITISGATTTSGGALALITPNTVFTAALTYNSGANLFVVNGTQDTAGTFGASALPSGLTQLTLGDNGASAQTLNGWLQTLKYFT